MDQLTADGIHVEIDAAESREYVVDLYRGSWWAAYQDRVERPAGG
jgi:hypothetical protein